MPRVLLLAALALAGCRAGPPSPRDTGPPDSLLPSDEEIAPGLHPRPSDSTRADTAGGWTTTPVVTAAPEPPPQAVLREVRTAAFDGFDRTIFEFTFGDPTPGVFVGYRAAPTSCFGGGPMNRVFASDTLVVAMTTARDTDPDNISRPVLHATYRTVDAPALRSVQPGCNPRRNQIVWALGVDGRRPFRVFTLDEPVRVVVDVRHP